MIHIRTGRLATVTSALALLVALSGTSYAALVVTSADIQDNTITTKDVKDKTLQVKDLSPQVKSSLRGHRGAAGPTGAAGATGPAGAAGAAGPQGPAGTAKASAQVGTGINPVYDANHGFPSLPRRIGVGDYCVPAPAGVNPDSTAVILGLSGDANNDSNGIPIGFVSQVGPPATLCRATEFEIVTRSSSGARVDWLYFNILVP